MGLKEEIRGYIQDDGLISPDRNPSHDSTGNGLLYLSLYHVLLVRLGLSRIDDLDAFEKTVNACVVSDDVGIRLKGLYYRSPTKKYDMEGWDDYIGLAAASRKIGSYVAWDILYRGRSSKYLVFRWVYNCLKPGKFTRQSWFGRRPAVPAHFQWASNVPPNPIRNLLLAASIVASAIFSIKNGPDFIQTWLMIDTCDSRSFMVVVAGAFWTWRARHAWGVNDMNDGLSAAMKLAIGKELGDNHPVTKYWR